jgi:hypothetical protein
MRDPAFGLLVVLAVALLLLQVTLAVVSAAGITLGFMWQAT